MKFTLAATALATAAVVAAEPAIISVHANNARVGYLYGMHEGAGFDYLFVGPTAQNLDYNTNSKVITAPFGQYTGQLGVGSFAPYLALGPAVTPLTLSLDDKRKILNYNFFSCQNTGDPYSFSKLTPVIIANAAGNNTLPFPGCTNVELFVRKPASSSSSSASASASSTVWTNTTITSYTTYCPLPTVVTITSCANNACVPTAITVTTATTIVCQYCVAPTTVAPQTTTAPKTTAPATTAPATISVVAGAAKNAIGAIGVAGVAAMLL
ncbi:hypothetical protein PUMCH_005004 [Australozyma saopauloensis]|uniref:Uncharacterized protein n=1 Tax=Australozyma saopauloensis TaxID=291208 RepID=A0AAX4HG51_9ASCO|nr:hypothetical protein PUMCH_005004 [[Candida] saopauloensis]